MSLKRRVVDTFDTLYVVGILFVGIMRALRDLLGWS